MSGKDPHPEVARTVHFLIEKINCEVEKEELCRVEEMLPHDRVTEAANPALALRPGEFEFGEWAAGYSGAGQSSSAATPSKQQTFLSKPSNSLLASSNIGQMPMIDEDSLSAEGADASITSNHLYGWNRQFFLAPDIGYDPYEDPLSPEAQIRIRRLTWFSVQ